MPGRAASRQEAAFPHPRPDRRPCCTLMLAMTFSARAARIARSNTRRSTRVDLLRTSLSSRGRRLFGPWAELDSCGGCRRRDDFEFVDDYWHLRSPTCRCTSALTANAFLAIHVDHLPRLQQPRVLDVVRGGNRLASRRLFPASPPAPARSNPTGACASGRVPTKFPAPTPFLLVGFVESGRDALLRQSNVTLARSGRPSGENISSDSSSDSMMPSN